MYISIYVFILEKFILLSDIPVTSPGHHGVATVYGDTEAMFPLVGGEGMACIRKYTHTVHTYRCQHCSLQLRRFCRFIISYLCLCTYVVSLQEHYQ